MLLHKLFGDLEVQPDIFVSGSVSLNQDTSHVDSSPYNYKIGGKTEKAGRQGIKALNNPEFKQCGHSTQLVLYHKCANQPCSSPLLLSMDFVSIFF